MSFLPIYFETPLVIGEIVKRSSMYTMLVSVDGIETNCHCPTTGRIGDIDIGGRPCLLSRSNDIKRKTPFTVEAISLNDPEDEEKEWIGINQNAINRYVEHYIIDGSFSDMVCAGDVRHEVFLGESKLDFLVGDTYLEVKTPLQNLQTDIPENIGRKKVTPFSSTERFVKHMTELSKSLSDHERAVLLICFMYDNPGFQVIERSTNFEEVQQTVKESVNAGVETWQANFIMTEEYVKLDRYFRIDVMSSRTSF